MQRNLVIAVIILVLFFVLALVGLGFFMLYRSASQYRGKGWLDTESGGSSSRTSRS